MAEKAPWRTQETPLAQRLRAKAMLAKIASGEIHVPLTCGWCNGSVIKSPRGELECLSCGRITTHETAHTVRRQKIVAMLRDGADFKEFGGLEGRRRDTPTTT